MADVTQIMYQHLELIEMMLRHQGIKEGHWVLSVNFGFGAGGIQQPDTQIVNPSAIVGVVGIGLQRSDPGAPQSVDASKL